MLNLTALSSDGTRGERVNASSDEGALVSSAALERKEPVAAHAGARVEHLLKVPRRSHEHGPLEDEDDQHVGHAVAVRAHVAEVHAAAGSRDKRKLAELPQTAAYED